MSMTVIKYQRYYI